MVEQIVTPRNFIVNLDDCYPEKLIVNRGEAEVDNDISRGNNLLNHPLSLRVWPLVMGKMIPKNIKRKLKITMFNFKQKNILSNLNKRDQFSHQTKN
jgi:hypothetical protein